MKTVARSFVAGLALAALARLGGAVEKSGAARNGSAASPSRKPREPR
jgi:hypothetical protein